MDRPEDGRKEPEVHVRGWNNHRHGGTLRRLCQQLFGEFSSSIRFHLRKDRSCRLGLDDS